MVRLKYVRLALFDIVTGISRIGLNLRIGRLKIQQRSTFCVPTSVNWADTAAHAYYGRPVLFGKVTETPKIRFQILIPRSETLTELIFDAPACCPKNDNKCTFSAPRLLGKAPVTVCVIDSCPELSDKVAAISYTGYQIQIVCLKIHQGPSLRTPRLLSLCCFSVLPKLIWCSSGDAYCASHFQSLSSRVCSREQVSFEGNGIQRFRDESRFNLWDHDGRIRVRRYAGERCLPECVIERHSGLTTGVMVWGAISHQGRSNLLRIEAGRRLACDPHPAASKEELLLRVQAMWNSLPQADIQNPFDSMPRRIAALIAARGCYTKY
ncbi:transposable element Tcb1 transposase [Trichonephila clavipes]|nr:transposable element Tcb1 transposase [Trichonephila clavipes]